MRIKQPAIFKEPNFFWSDLFLSINPLTLRVGCLDQLSGACTPSKGLRYRSHFVWVETKWDLRILSDWPRLRQEYFSQVSLLGKFRDGTGKIWDGQDYSVPPDKMKIGYPQEVDQHLGVNQLWLPNAKNTLFPSFFNKEALKTKKKCGKHFDSNIE